MEVDEDFALLTFSKNWFAGLGVDDVDDEADEVVVGAVVGSACPSETQIVVVTFSVSVT